MVDYQMQWPKSEPMLELFVGHSVTSRNTYTKNRWVRHECPNWRAGFWVGAQVDPLVVFVDVVSELGWG